MSPKLSPYDFTRIRDIRLTKESNRTIEKIGNLPKIKSISLDLYTIRCESNNLYACISLLANTDDSGFFSVKINDSHEWCDTLITSI